VGRVSVGDVGRMLLGYPPDTESYPC
jgi:hypothetical protein